MKRLSKCVCLALPAGIAIPCFFGGKGKTAYVQGSHLSGVARRFWWLIPFVVLAVRSQAGESDKRPWKLWAPYDMMCRKVAETYGYVLDHGRIIAAHDYNGYLRTCENEKSFPLLVRGFRRWMPYGLVLWWDREARVAGSTKPAPTKSHVNAPEGNPSNDMSSLMSLLRQLDVRVGNIERQVSLRSDNIETQILKVRVEIDELKGIIQGESSPV